MKTFVHLVFICLLICGSGCMTNATVEKARGLEVGSHRDDKGANVTEYKDPKPGYYCFVPFTVAVDIATSPIQIPIYIWAKSEGLDQIH